MAHTIYSILIEPIIFKIGQRVESSLEIFILLSINFLINVLIREGAIIITFCIIIFSLASLNISVIFVFIYIRNEFFLWLNK